jgi:hypothetical protein
LFRFVKGWAAIFLARLWLQHVVFGPNLKGAPQVLGKSGLFLPFFFIGALTNDENNYILCYKGMI